MPAEVFVARARRDTGHALLLVFSDGTRRRVDFERFLSGSNNPQIRAFLDYKKFASFSIQNGDLVWGDWELCFPIADLYRGRI